MTHSSLKPSVTAINTHGILLLYPIKNKSEPKSLWSCLHPRTKMKWEWDDNMDNKVFKLWRLREELSKSNLVVYTKWYQGRGTFFSLEMYSLFVSVFCRTDHRLNGLSPLAKEIYQTLEMDSPLSPKIIKKNLNIKGVEFKKDFDKAVKELWSQFLIVGFGEVNDGAFPSLALGASSLLFETPFKKGRNLKKETARKMIVKKLEGKKELLKYFLKINHANEMEEVSL